MNKLHPEKKSGSLRVLPTPTRNNRKNIKYWVRIYRKRFLINLRKLKGEPGNLARGLAIGVFAGCFPFFGVQSLIGVVLAATFRCSKVAAIAGTWISNPLTYIPIFVFNFKVGKLLLGVQSISSKEVNFESLSSFMQFGSTFFKESGSTFAIVLLTGCLVVGSALAVITYFVSLPLFKRLQRKKFKAINSLPVNIKNPPN